MATLPDQSTSARPTPQVSGDVAYIRHPTTGMEDAPAQTLARGGSDMNAAGNELNAMVQKQMDHIDLTAAEDAFNKIQQKKLELEYGQGGFKTVQGSEAMKPEFRTRYSTALQDAGKQLLEGLANDRQRELLRPRIDFTSNQLSAGLLQHAAVESEKFADATEKNSVAVAINNITADWGNDINFATQLARIGGIIDARGSRQNQPAKETEFEKINTFNQAWGARVKSAALNDPLAGRKMFEEHKRELGPTQLIALDEFTKKAVEPVYAKFDADEAIRVVQPVAAPPQPSVTLIMDTVIGKESGGNPAAVSPKGALGLTQVMPGTARMVAQQMGLPYDEKLLTANTPEGRTYNRTLGTQYLQNMLVRYDQNRTLALAAYNAGPEKVDEWVARFGDPRSGAISNQEFTDKITFPETKDYVLTIEKKLGGPGPGDPMTRTGTKASLGAWLLKGAELADKRYPGDPVYADRVTTQIKGYAATIESAQAGQERQNYQTLYGAAVGGNNAPKPLTLDQLIATPQARAAYIALDPTKQEGLQRLVQMNAKEAMDGHPMRSDSRVVMDLFRRITLAKDDDPQKITSVVQLAPFLGMGLNQSNHDWLATQIDKQQSFSGRSMSKDIQHAGQTATQMLRGSIQGQVQPDVAIEAGHRFTVDLQNRIDQYAKDGKNWRTLITPGAADYMLNPAVVSTYMQTSPADALKGKADQARAAQQAVSGKITKPLVQIKSDAEYEKLPPGEFLDPNGVKRVKQ